MNVATASLDVQTKAETLAEALPYIRTYRGQTVVVKIGGAALHDPELAAVVAEDLALLGLVGIRLVAVHGGGPQVTEAMQRAGIPSTFRDGLRVTDHASMQIVQSVLMGTINPDLVTRMTHAGLSAVGLWGGDGRMLTAVPIARPDGVELGRVGQIESVDTRLITSLLEAGYTPVLVSVAPGGDGLPMNVNADEVAGALGRSLGAAKLVYLTNVDGLYRDLGNDDSLVSEISAQDLESLRPSLSEGMRPKIDSALSALAGGVGKVHILDGRVRHALLLEVFTRTGIGTQVLP